MDIQSEINGSYKRLADKYDSRLSTKSWWSRALSRFFWGFSKPIYAKPLLDLLPDDFSGTLLDVPAGTGLFTAAKYATLKQADISCVDYSNEMLIIAAERFRQANINNVSFRQGDVGKLDFTDNSFDVVLSMNGFHVFPDKEAAYRELARVLKQNGVFLGCFYIKGESKRTDWAIRHHYARKHYFTPPFQTRFDVEARLKQSFSEVKVWTEGAMLCFYCVK